MKNILILLFVVIVQFDCYQNNSGNHENVNKEKISISEELRHSEYFNDIENVDEAKIKQEVEIIDFADSSFESIKKQRTPEFTFIFTCQKGKPNNCSWESEEQKMPEKSEKIINQYWQEAIKFRYLQDVQGSKYDLNKLYRLLDIHSENSGKFLIEIRKVEIDAPNGRRKISRIEARQLMASINRFAMNVVAKSQEQKDSKLI